MEIEPGYWWARLRGGLTIVEVTKDQYVNLLGNDQQLPVGVSILEFVQQIPEPE